MYWALAYRDLQNHTQKTFSVMTYGVQLSQDGGNWSDLPCADRVGTCRAPIVSACIFESSVLASQPDEIVHNLFNEPQLARFVKILPWTWSRMEEKDLSLPDDTIYAEMRVGVIGVSRTGSVPFRLVADGFNPHFICSILKHLVLVSSEEVDGKVTYENLL